MSHMVDAPASQDDAVVQDVIQDATQHVVQDVIQDATQNVVQDLRDAGLRVTLARQAVLSWLTAHPHTTADAIADGVRERFGALSRQAIYGVLAACTDAGLLRRIEPAGHPVRFERRVGGHHHLVCRGCGRTGDTGCVAGERRCLGPGNEHDYVIDRAEVVFWGLCPACQAARA